MTTVAAALAAARRKLPANEARLLLGSTLNRSSAWVLANDDATLAEDQLLQYAAWVARRAGGEPIAYLLGRREFYGREFIVSPAVLIPRPDTELLVELALEQCASRRTTRILDLGTGSGCLAVTLALEIPGAEVVAVDVSPEALDIAQRNAEALGAEIGLRQGSWFAGMAGGEFDLIVANPPYIAAGDPHLAAGDLRHEPPGALISGPDGLDAIREIAANAAAHLAPGGTVLIEHGYDQASAVADLLRASGHSDIEHHRDLAGIERVTSARQVIRASGYTGAQPHD